MDTNRPIGVIDSGVGGLSVLRALQQTMPHETFLYLGDTARAPYGTRSRETITAFVAQMTDWLEQKGIKQLVAACTVLGTDVIRGAHTFPVIGMSKGVDLVLQATKNKHIGLMATDFTVGTGAHRKEIQAADPAAEVFGVGCTKFVPLIEGNRFGSPELKEAIREYAEALQAKQVDSHFGLYPLSLCEKLSGRSLRTGSDRHRPGRRHSPAGQSGPGSAEPAANRRPGPQHHLLHRRHTERETVGRADVRFRNL